MIRPMLIPLMLSALLLAGCAAAPAQTPEPARPATPSAAAEPGRPVSPRGFTVWIGQFSERARAAGIDEGTLRSAFANVRYRPDVVRADREQPEFTRAIWDYLDRALSSRSSWRSGASRATTAA